MIPEKIQEKLRTFEPKYYPWLFKAHLIAVVAAALAVPILLLAIPYLDIFNDMAVQPKGKAQGTYGRYGAYVGEAERITERAPVAGTLPMDYHPYKLVGQDEETLRVASETLVNPLVPTMEILERGQKHFERLCFTCHGKTGEGNGKIVGPDLFPAPPSLHTDAARAFKDGRIFHIITRGQNDMPSYADVLTEEERWEVILYVRALQRAMNPEPEDLKDE